MVPSILAMWLSFLKGLQTFRNNPEKVDWHYRILWDMSKCSRNGFHDWYCVQNINTVNDIFQAFPFTWIPVWKFSVGGVSILGGYWTLFKQVERAWLPTAPLLSLVTFPLHGVIDVGQVLYPNALGHDDGRDESIPVEGPCLLLRSMTWSHTRTLSFLPIKVVPMTLLTHSQIRPILLSRAQSVPISRVASLLCDSDRAKNWPLVVLRIIQNCATLIGVLHKQLPRTTLVFEVR